MFLVKKELRFKTLKNKLQDGVYLLHNAKQSDSVKQKSLLLLVKLGKWWKKAILCHCYLYEKFTQINLYPISFNTNPIK